jgi:hypothetical protein
MSGQGHDREMHGMSDQQPPQDGLGLRVHMHFEIRDGKGDHQVVHGVLPKRKPMAVKTPRG